MANFRKIIKTLMPKQMFQSIEPAGHLVESVIANIRYGFPSRRMHVIGVTGTDGKTTTSLMIQKMLHTAGIKSAVLSTVSYGVGDDIKQQMVHMTTSQSGILQKRLRDFKKAGAEWVVIETSSHSLAQNRVWGIPYEIAVMTNITYDHLDYHKTFENYLVAKRRLFKIASRHGKRFGVVNADDKNAERFISAVPRSMTYGIKSGQLKAEKIKTSTDHSTYTARIGDDTYDIRVNIPGEFNVSNSLAAVAVGREMGLSKEQIEKGIVALKAVEGRMTVIDKGQKFKVIVDYASTPEAFEKVFSSLRPSVKGKLIAVFGSAGGQRDKAKRPMQGEIAGKYADEVILTEEDDRDSDGNEILRQIADGAKKSGKTVDKDLFMLLNREEAIGYAMTRAKNASDMVILLGKGHEKTIERANGENPWNEIEAAESSLLELQKTKK